MEDKNQPKDDVENKPQEINNEENASKEVKQEEPKAENTAKVEQKDEVKETNVKSQTDFKVSANQPKPEKKKSKGKKVAISISLILIIAIAAVAVYYFMFFTKPEEVYKRTIGATLDSYSNNLKNTDYKTMKNSIKLSANIDVEDESIDKDTVKAINDSEIEFETQVDKEDKKFIMNIESNYGKDDLLNLQFYTDSKDQKTYIKLEDLLNKYIEVKMDEDYYNSFSELFEGTTNVNSDKKQIGILKNELIKIVKPEYCSSKKEDIMVNGQKINATKNILKLNAKQLQDELVTLFENLKNNDEFLNCYENKESVKSSLESLIEEFEDIDFEDEVTVEFDLFTNGFMQDVVMFAISVNNEDEEETSTIVVGKASDTTYELEFIVNDEAIFTGKTVIEEKNENEGNITFDTNIKEFGKLSLNIEYSQEFDEELEKVNAKDVTSFEKMSLSDMKKFAYNLQNSKSPLYKLIAYSTGLNKISSSGSLVNNPTTSPSGSNSSSSSSSLTDKTEQTDKNVIITYDDKTKITYGVPSNYSVSVTSDSYKRLQKGDVSIRMTSKRTNKDKYYSTLESNKEYYEKNDTYSDITLTKPEEVDINGKKFYTATFSYKSKGGFEYGYQYYWTEVSDTYVMDVEIRGYKDLNSDDLKEILNIKVENNK